MQRCKRLGCVPDGQGVRWSMRARLRESVLHAWDARRRSRISGRLARKACINLGLHTSDSRTSRGRRPRGATPRRRIARGAGPRRRRRRLGRASRRRRRTRRPGALGRLRAAPARRGPRGPIRDTIPKSPARPTVSPVGDDAALWCFVSLRRAAPTKTKARGVEAVEAAPGPR